jgi:hypothetical protein
MAAAARAKLLDRKFLGLPLLVPARSVITPLAGVACQSNQISHLITLALPDSLNLYDPDTLPAELARQF